MPESLSSHTELGRRAITLNGGRILVDHIDAILPWPGGPNDLGVRVYLRGGQILTLEDALVENVVRAAGWTGTPNAA